MSENKNKNRRHGKFFDQRLNWKKKEINKMKKIKV
jgi:hypothetical protein